MARRRKRREDALSPTPEMRPDRSFGGAKAEQQRNPSLSATPKVSDSGPRLDMSTPSRSDAIRKRNPQRSAPRRPAGSTGGKPSTAFQSPSTSTPNPIAPTPEAMPTTSTPSPRQNPSTGDRLRTRLARESDDRMRQHADQFQQGVDDPRARLALTPEMGEIAGRAARSKARIGQEQERIDQIGNRLATDQAIEQGDAQVLQSGRSTGVSGAVDRRVIPGGTQPFEGEIAQERRRRVMEAPTGVQVGQTRRTPASPEEQERSRVFDQARTGADVGEMPDAYYQQDVREREQLGLEPRSREEVARMYQRSESARTARGTDAFQEAQGQVVDARNAQRERAQGIRQTQIARDRERREGVQDARSQARQDDILGRTPEMRHQQEMTKTQAESRRDGTRADVINVGGRPFDRSTRQFLDEDGGETSRSRKPQNITPREQARLDTLQQSVESIDRLMGYETDGDRLGELQQRRQKFIDEIWSMTEESGGANEPPQEHLDALKSDPSPRRRQQFDEVYGEGAADRVLGG